MKQKIEKNFLEIENNDLKYAPPHLRRWWERKWEDGGVKGMLALSVMFSFLCIKKYETRLMKGIFINVKVPAFLHSILYFTF